MNSFSEPSNTQNPKPRRRGRLLSAISCITILATLTISTFFVTGCRRPPRGSGGTTTTSTLKVDPWEDAERKLKKDTDFGTCQAVLRTLVNSFHDDDALPRPASLTSDRRGAIADVPLNQADEDEIRNWNYSSHDGAYLAECFYMRDAAQSLKLPNLPPDQLADLAFAWVCRSVSLTQTLLKPLLIPERNGLIASVLPPTYVLRRGYGSALERMYVFLALLQQLDLDGCLIGPPPTGDPRMEEVGAWNVIGPNNIPYPGGPSRPFWAVGVRIGSDIRVYDPWRGEPFPANLNQLKTNPDAHKGWFENLANLSKLKPDDVKTATIYLALPVNAISPRMEMLHQKLKDTLGVRLAIKPTVFRSAFPDPKPTFWNPPNDRFAYGRVARTFLPRDRGGDDETAPSPNRMYDVYIGEQLPSGLVIFLPELQGNDTKTASDRLLGVTRAIYMHAFVETSDQAPNARERSQRQDAPGGSERDWEGQTRNPREQIQRGQFQDAIHDLVDKRDRFEKHLERLRYATDMDMLIQAWCVVTKQLYEDLGRTVLIPNKDEKASALAEAQAAIDKHWRDDAVTLMINRVSAPICRAEATFLFAKCKHEMAERTQARADHATKEDAAKLKEQATEAWREALSAWQTYQENNAPQTNNLRQIAEATALTDRAAKFAKK